MSINFSQMREYAIYTLIASYWYRKAYFNHPAITHRVYLSPRERVALHLAEHYDSLAAQAFRAFNGVIASQNEALSTYHNIYTLWRDNGFSESLFEILTNPIRSIRIIPLWLSF